jgi:hypothetical protein
MSLVSSNVRVAVTGVVSVGATSTTAPTSVSSALDAGFKDLGYVGEDGVTETRNRDTNKIKAWQNADVVREVVTESDLQFKFVLIESKKETVETFYGASVDSATGKIVIVPASTGGRKSWVYDIVDGSKLIRTYAAEGEVTEVGDVVYVSGDPIGYEVTVTCYPNSTIGGTAVRWQSDLVVTP